MKCLSIQQPWATLIAYGIKDVENRPDRKLIPPQRILIHVGAKSRGSLDELPLAYSFPIDYAEEIGAFDSETAQVKSAIIGYVDVVDIVDNSDSRWAQYAPEGEKPLLHYILRNARLFKNPILGVKGRLGVWDIPEIDENNLPETVEIPNIVRDNKTLTIPLGTNLWNQLSAWYHDSSEAEFEIELTALDSNIPLIFKENGVELVPLPTKDVIFKNGFGAEIDTEFVDAYTEFLTWEDTGEPIDYEDGAGNEYTACVIRLIIKRK